MFPSATQAALVAAPLVAAVFFILWLVQLRTRDASAVDTAWSAALGALAVFYAAVSDGAPARRLVLAVTVAIWALRLARHIHERHRPGVEDGRYRAIRERRGDKAQTFFFFFYQFQGALALVLSVPFLLVAYNPAPGLDALEVTGFVLALIGVAGETVADRQLEAHRRGAAGSGTTCRSGLWRYSRHPNYFFEWLVWCGFAAAALPAPGGALGLLSPALMLALILWVTGIPPNEERNLERRGDDYRAYQATTSAFVPWFPRKERTT